MPRLKTSPQEIHQALKDYNWVKNAHALFGSTGVNAFSRTGTCKDPKQCLVVYNTSVHIFQAFMRQQATRNPNRREKTFYHGLSCSIDGKDVVDPVTRKHIASYDKGDLVHVLANSVTSITDNDQTAETFAQRSGRSCSCCVFVLKVPGHRAPHFSL